MNLGAGSIVQYLEFLYENNKQTELLRCENEYQKLQDNQRIMNSGTKYHYYSEVHVTL